MEKDLNPLRLVRTVSIGPVGGEDLYAYRLRALIRYKELNCTVKEPDGHMRVPYNFRVPWSHDWPQEFWDLGLGSLVDQVRRGLLYKVKHVELEAAGFDFKRQACGGENAIGWDRVEAALLAYKVVNPRKDKKAGDLNRMSKKFEVPSDDRNWPEATWGLKIGTILYNVRNANYYKAHSSELEDMGVEFKASV